MTILQYLEDHYIDAVACLEKGTLPEELCLLYVNPFNYFWFRDNLGLVSKTFYRVDGIYASGIIGWFTSIPRPIRRQSFDMTSLAPMVFRYCEDNNLSIFIAGGKDNDAALFAIKIKELFPSLNIKSCVDGYRTEEEIIRLVVESNCDISIFGLGNIKQESVASKLSVIRPSRYFTCGAFISQTARSEAGFYYPAVVDRLNLRWLYRFFKENHIIGRVLRFYPKFLFAVVADKLKS